MPSMMADWLIEQLYHIQYRADFSSGERLRDELLRSLVTQNDERDLGLSYVSVPSCNTKVRG